MKKVMIVGGGTGATILANSLDRRRFDITVLSKSLAHVFQPALLYVAFKDARPDVVRDERGLLARHVRFLEEPATRIDLRGHVVTTGNGARYDYDDIVIATGVTTDPSQIPGSARSMRSSATTTPASRRRGCGRTSTPSAAARSRWGRVPRSSSARRRPWRVCCWPRS